jgi:hypothetical protein
MPGRASILRRPMGICLIFGCIYLLTWGGHYTSGDGFQKIAWARSMLFRHTANLNEAGPPAFSKYSVGHSLLTIPVLAAANLITRFTHIRCEAALYTLLFIANGVLFLYLAGIYLRRRYSMSQAWYAVLILGLCTAWWPYTKLDFSEPLVLTFLFSGFLLASGGRPIIGVLLASFAITIRPDSVIPTGILCLWLGWRAGNWRLLLRTIPAIVPALLINSVCNYLRWGTIREIGYAGETFSNPFLMGIYGLLFSSGKSVFLFSPPLIAGFVGLRRFANTTEGRQDALFFLSVFLTELLLYSKWWDWSGDDAWGVRFMLPGVMLMCLPAVELSRKSPKTAALSSAPLEEIASSFVVSGRVSAAFGLLKFRIVLTLVAGTGLVVQLLGVLISGLDYDLLVRQQTMERIALYQTPQTTNRIDFDDIRFNPRYGQIAGNWLLLRLAAGFPPGLANAAEAERTGTPLYDALIRSGWHDRPKLDLFWLHPHGAASR